MNNIVYAILPFLLFGFICTVLTKPRFAEMLKDCPAFYAPHRAYIVNLDYVSGLRGSDILIGGGTVPIAKGALPKFKTYFFQYTFRE